MFTVIEFDYVDWDNGFIVTLRVPYSLKNFDGIIALRNSRDIKLIK